MKVCVLYSGGKDSTYAVHYAFLKGFDVVCLVTVKPKHEDSLMFHVPHVNLTKLQAIALNLPQIYSEIEKSEEINELRNCLRIAIKDYDIEGIVVGALLSDYQRMNINLIAEELGLKTFSPLWRKSQEKYLLELIEQDFSIIITAIDTYGLLPKFLGKILTKNDVLEIIERSRKYGFNPAFEGGEAETLVINAPLFKKILNIKKSKIVKLSEYSWRLLIKEVELIDK